MFESILSTFFLSMNFAEYWRGVFAAPSVCARWYVHLRLEALWHLRSIGTRKKITGWLLEILRNQSTRNLLWENGAKYLKMLNKWPFENLSSIWSGWFFFESDCNFTFFHMLHLTTSTGRILNDANISASLVYFYSTCWRKKKSLLPRILKNIFMAVQIYPVH